MSLLSRMLLREMALPFLFSFCALNVLLLVGSLLPLLEPLLKAGIEPVEMVRFVVLLLPTFWVYVLPMATLLGVLLAFLRVSRDSELLALLACGIGPKRFLVPVIMVSVTAWLLCLFVSASLVPKAKSASKNFLRELTGRALARGIPEKVFLNPIAGLTIYVDKSLDGGRRFKGVFIRDSRRKDTANQILAREGELTTQQDGSDVALRLHYGTLNRIGSDYQKFDTLDFESYALRLSLAAGSRKPRKSELGLGDLLEVASDPHTSDKHRQRYLTEFHERLAIPVGTLILGIMAAPLGIFFGRTGLSGGIALGLTAFLAFYLSVAFGANMADTGTISPGIALWTPVFVFAGITAGLIWLLNKRGPLRG